MGTFGNKRFCGCGNEELSKPKLTYGHRKKVERDAKIGMADSTEIKSGLPKKGPKFAFLMWIYKTRPWPLNIDPGYLIYFWPLSAFAILLVGSFTSFISQINNMNVTTSNILFLLPIPLLLTSIATYIILPHIFIESSRSKMREYASMTNIPANDILLSVRLLALKICITMCWSSSLAAYVLLFQSLELLDELKAYLLALIFVLICILFIETSLSHVFISNSARRTMYAGYFVGFPLLVLLYIAVKAVSDFIWKFWYGDTRVFNKDLAGIQITPYLYGHKLPPNPVVISDMWYLLNYAVILIILLVTIYIWNFSLVKKWQNKYFGNI